MFYEVKKTSCHFGDTPQTVSVFFQDQKKAMEYRDSLIENAKQVCTDPNISEDGETICIVSWQSSYEAFIEFIPRAFAD